MDAQVGMRRRELLLGAAACCCMGSALAAGAAYADPPQSEMPQVGDKLVFDAGDNDGKPVTASCMTPDCDAVLAVPSTSTGEKKTASRFSKVILVRLKPEEITEEYKPNAVDGIVAFSAICTHQGCTLSTFKKETRLFECFCHHSQYRPADGGAIARGPTRKRLPMLPIARGDNDVLIVAGDFIGKPGPGPA